MLTDNNKILEDRLTPTRVKNQSCGECLNASFSHSNSTGPSSEQPQGMSLRVGEIVEVRSIEEILATLDAKGTLGGLQFMPEMLKYCGHRLPVSKRAERTCAHGEQRNLNGAVHLGQVRCDGSAHSDCQAKCLIFWKEAWLKRIPFGDQGSSSGSQSSERQETRADTSQTAETFLNTHVKQSDGTLSCQSTELRRATRSSELGNHLRYVSNFARDFWCRKVNWTDLRWLFIWLRGRIIWTAFTKWARAPWNSSRYRKTPTERLNLRPGELVRVRNTWEILKTLDRKACNRGLVFKPEMFHYCGRKFCVFSKLDRRIIEQTGQLVDFGNGCVLLEGVFCHGVPSFCTRSNYHYWREIWLRRC
jgi:hypothetical protein